MFVWMPATHLQPGEVCIHASGSIGVLDVGPHQGADAASLSEQLCAVLQSAGFDAIARPDILRWKYAKWLTNLGNTAQALIYDDWRKVAALAQKEGEAILSDAGIDRVSPEELLKRTTNVKLTKISGEDRSGGSTWQSQQRGQPLETPFIEGAMADLADARGLSAPVNRYLADLAQDPRRVSAAEAMSAAGVKDDQVFETY